MDVGGRRAWLQAHRQVVECRRILKWTYAYGYYKFDTLALEPADGASPEETERLKEERAALNNRKAFFEFQQVRLALVLVHSGLWKCTVVVQLQCLFSPWVGGGPLCCERALRDSRCLASRGCCK